MGKTTYIEWCDSSVNLQMGCSGCELWNATVRTCYAGVLTRKYEGRAGWPQKFEQPAVFPDRLAKALAWPDLTGQARPDKPWLNGYPRLIFLNDMGDTFTEGLPVDWLSPFVPRMEASPHIWMLLTKRPQRMQAFFAGLGRVPRNFWLGTTLTTRATLPRLEHLRHTGDAQTVRWLSIEPLLEDLTPLDLLGVGGVIVGGESGAGARPMAEAWVLAIRNACDLYGTRLFFKQWGADANNPDPADPTMKSRGGNSKGGARLDGCEWRDLPEVAY